MATVRVEELHVDGLVVDHNVGIGGNSAGPVRCIKAINKSGAAVAAGDLVIYDLSSNTTADQIAFTTTTSANSTAVLGMAFEAIANGDVGLVQVGGPTTALKVDGTTDIAIGDYIGTSTTAKIGAKTTTAGARAAIACEAYATNDTAGVIDAILITFGPHGF